MPSASPVKKTDIARALAQEGRHPMKAIIDTMGVSRSNQYGKKRDRGRYAKPGDEHYLRLIRNITDERATYGYRRVTAILNRHLTLKGQPRVNHKRIYRIIKLNNLLLQKHTGKLIRLHEGTIIILASNMRWHSDIFEIPCLNGERLRVIFALDCCDREILNYLSTTGVITANMVKDIMALAIEDRFGLVDRVPHTPTMVRPIQLMTRQPLPGSRDLSYAPLHTGVPSRTAWQSLL